VDVQTELDIDVQPIFKSMKFNEAKLEAAFPLEFKMVMRATGTPRLKASNG
jgi:hypothetical protein